MQCDNNGNWMTSWLAFGNGRFLFSVLSIWRIMISSNFYRESGYSNSGRRPRSRFPSVKSRTIIETLEQMRRAGATIKPADEIGFRKENEDCFIVKSSECTGCDRFIVTTGGSPLTGSTGFGYEIARHFNARLPSWSCWKPFWLTFRTGLQEFPSDVTLGYDKHAYSRLALLLWPIRSINSIITCQASETIYLDLLPQMSKQVWRAF